MSFDCLTHSLCFISYCPLCSVNLCDSCQKNHESTHSNLLLIIPQIISKNYKVLSFLGQGAFGYVFKLQNKFTVKINACKIFKIPKKNMKLSSTFNLEDNPEIKNIFNELQIQSKMNISTDFKRKPIYTYFTY